MNRRTFIASLPIAAAAVPTAAATKNPKNPNGMPHVPLVDMDIEIRRQVQRDRYPATMRSWQLAGLLGLAVDLAGQLVDGHDEDACDDDCCVICLDLPYIKWTVDRCKDLIEGGSWPITDGDEERIQRWALRQIVLLEREDKERH